MEIFLILKTIFIIGIVIALYAVARNLDIIKIILIYWKDLILRSSLTNFLTSGFFTDNFDNHHTRFGF